MPHSAQSCAREILQTIPKLMRIIRAEMRRNRGTDLTVPQFRALVFLQGNPGASLSAIADLVGTSLPAMSKMMDGLASRGLVARQGCHTDRRRLLLELTPAGHAAVNTASAHAQAGLAESLQPLNPEERREITDAMRRIRNAFSIQT